MKINRLEAHDRLLDLKKKGSDLSEFCQNIIDQRPFGNNPFYIFAHARTADDGVTKRVIWQPRLTKPKAQTNSMLFKAYPGTDKIDILWMIPAVELWGQYIEGNVTEDNLTFWSIEMFKNHKKKLEEKDPDDLNDEKIDQIYKGFASSAKCKKLGLIL